jgi:two-component system response regulator PilR (NtrC family)
MLLMGPSAVVTGASRSLGRTMLGRSAPMQEVHRLIEQAAATPAPVLIHGETGTGKELVKTLHNMLLRWGLLHRSLD